jgi:outer membrane autotransporter protein
MSLSKVSFLLIIFTLATIFGCSYNSSSSNDFELNVSGENQNFAINNTAVSYNDSNQRNTYATLNAGTYYPLTPTIKAYAQVRYYDSDKNIDSLSGSIGISGQF